MLWPGLILVGICLLGAPPSAAGAPVAGAAPPSDESVPQATGPREAWYVRGLSAFFARRAPDEDAALAADPQLARRRFLPYAGRRIQGIYILGREAFGTVAPAGAGPVAGTRPDSLRTRAGPFERWLNSLAVPTRSGVLRHFLLFGEGQLLVPARLADSERLLRQQVYVRDALIIVLPLAEQPDAVDVVVLVRDRWPWGVQASVRSADSQQVAVFHRNAAGLGLNLEVELLHDRTVRPADGWRTRASATNVGGSFVHLALDTWRSWERDQTAFAAERSFDYPDIRLLGGLLASDETRRGLSELPRDEALRSRTRETWLGWNVHLRPSAGHDERRLRLVPALRVQDVRFDDPPLAFAPNGRLWRDHRRYLLQCNLTGLDYYTAGLIYDYGETEDIPVGLWAALVGGIETGAAGDRGYHGGRVIWPRLTRGRRYVAVEGSLGGFRRQGRLEDGVLDLGLRTFSPLQRNERSVWRHFLRARYTLGLNQADPAALRLEEVALRDLDDPALGGGQRLIAECESVLFTSLVVAGFKVAAFGYAGGGLLAREREAIFAQRLHANLGVGLRLNNPGLVLPTIEMRLGLLSSLDGWQPAATVRMGEVRFATGRLPGAQPELLPYR